MVYPHAFIGHAYGSPYLSKENNFLSPNVVDFIEKNNSNLGSIIFTGDLFRVPSLEKWQRIRSLVGNDTKIFIAPGNHDIARSDSKDVFDSTEFGANKYPLLTNIDNTPLIIENSIESNWVVKDNAVNIINEVKDDFIIIARHNIPIVNFLSLVNSEEGRSENLESIEKIY